MRKNNETIEPLRLRRFSSRADGNNGLFLLKMNNRRFKIMVSDGEGWDHVSVSTENRCPNWIEMSTIKELFFEPEETVVQFHPKASEYVNNHPYCLHLWRNQNAEHELPPSILTGIKDLTAEIPEHVRKHIQEVLNDLPELK